MKIKPIKTKEEYNQTIARIDLLFDALKGSEEENELNLLILAVNKYEAENYPIDEPDPKEYIKIRMEEMALITKNYPATSLTSCRITIE